MIDIMESLRLGRPLEDITKAVGLLLQLHFIHGGSER